MIQSKSRGNRDEHGSRKLFEAADYAAARATGSPGARDPIVVARGTAVDKVFEGTFERGAQTTGVLVHC